jgi:hypothetical protein
MTVIELFIFVAMIALGVLFARSMYPHGILLAVIGFACGLAVIPAIWFAYLRYRRWLYVGDKWMPDCVCGSSAFKHERVGSELHLLCQKCERRYQKRRDYVWALNGEEKTRYKQLVKRKGWV